MSPSPLLPTIGASITVLAATTAFLTGCSSSPADLPDPLSAPAGLEHVHSLAVEPGDGTLTVATHEGIYRLDIAADGTATSVGPIGGLDFDAMGFTTSDGIAYASGHPGPTTPTTFGSPNLGLITSTDRGETWTNISLAGQTDFHALAVLPALQDGDGVRIVGIDTSKQAIQRSLDGGKTWTDGPDLVARDLLSLPSSDLLYATTDAGLAVSTDDAATFTIDPEAPALYLIGADPVDGTLAGVDVTGTLWTTDSSGEWSEGGHVAGAPQAFATVGGRVYVADDRGIAITDDLGSTWTVVKLK